MNAIIHRDYTGAQIQMRVWDDRIELWNDGELPFGQTIESLKQAHSSKPRNRCIANVFYKAGFIESWGRGIDKICDGFTAKGFEEPVFEHNSGGVLCTLYRKDTAALFAGNEDVTLGQNVQKTVEKVTEKVTENQAVILNKIARNFFVTAQQLSEILHISLRKTKENISKLKEKGLIRRIGADKGGHWEIVVQ